VDLGEKLVYVNCDHPDCLSEKLLQEDVLQQIEHIALIMHVHRYVRLLQKVSVVLEEFKNTDFNAVQDW
jgi:hypothetical protein